MAERNGTATSSILRLGSLVPERLPVAIERGGEEVILQGYVYGRRCPGLVKAECSAAEDARRAAFSDPTLDESVRATAWITFLRTYLLALVPGLAFDEADILAGDSEAAIGVLRYLGAWMDAEPEAESDGEADAAPPLTTASSLPTSSPATDPSTT